MNFAEVLSKPFLFSYEGRLNRQRYWAYALLVLLAYVVTSLVDYLLGSSIFTMLLVLANLYPSVCVSIKRWHDRDKSGWWVLIGLVPVIGAIWSFVELGCLRGSVGDNRYGPDSLAAA